MAAEAPISAKDLPDAIIKDDAEGRKRNPLADGEIFLASRKSPSREITRSEERIQDILTIVVANHFCPKWKKRGKIFSSDRSSTTPHSIETTAQVSLAVAELTHKKPSWVVDADIDPDKLEITLGKWRIKMPIPFKKMRKMRKAQLAAIRVYEQIPRSRKNKNVFHHLRAAVKAGKVIGVYPEGKPGFAMRDYEEGFEKLFDVLSILKVPYQILPVTIDENSIRLHPVMQPEGDSKAFADKIMRTVASGLPDEKKGYWKPGTPMYQKAA